MVTTIRVEEEAHICAIRKQTEFREAGCRVPSITDLINKASVIGMKSINVSGSEGNKVNNNEEVNNIK